MRAKTHTACTARSPTLILITAASDEKAMDHGDRSTSAEVASRRSARGCAATRDHRWTGRRRGEARFDRCVVARQGVGRYAAAVGELGHADATSPAALPLASDGPRGLQPESAPCPPDGRAAPTHRRGSRPGFDQGPRSPRRRRPARDGARARRRRRRQEWSRPGPAQRATRGAPGVASRPGRRGEDGVTTRPRRPVSRTR